MLRVCLTAFDERRESFRPEITLHPKSVLSVKAVFLDCLLLIFKSEVFAFEMMKITDRHTILRVVSDCFIGAAYVVRILEHFAVLRSLRVHTSTIPRPDLN